MTPLSINPYNASLDSVKAYTIVSTRPDLLIGTRFQLKYFAPAEYLNKESWEHEDFDYDISELGFRDNDIPNHVDIAAFGCSFTFGQAMPSDKLWHKILANNIGYTTYNFGQPGAGIEAIVDIFLIVSQYVKIQKLILLAPPYHRMLVAAMNNDSETLGLVPTFPNYKSRLEGHYNIDISKIYMVTPDVQMKRIFKDRLFLLEHICRNKNIQLYTSSWDQETYNFM